MPGQPARRAQLLLVAFDDVRVADAGGLGVEARLAQRAPLAQQVPALVSNLQKSSRRRSLGRRGAFGLALPEPVLLGDELLDPVVYLIVVHSFLLSSLLAVELNWLHARGDGSSQTPTVERRGARNGD